jgi:hypothetical protein
MIGWIEAQLPGKFIKCYGDGCIAEISSEYVFDIMPTSYNSLVEDFYARRNEKLIAAPGKCPRCRMHVEKDEGCDHMTCPCGTQFCYRCGDYWKCLCAPRENGAVLYDEPEIIDHTRRHSLINRLVRGIDTDNMHIRIFSIWAAYYNVIWLFILIKTCEVVPHTAESLIIFSIIINIALAWAANVSAASFMSVSFAATNICMTVITFPREVDYSWLILACMHMPIVFIMTIKERHDIMYIIMAVSTVTFYMGYTRAVYCGFTAVYTIIAIAEMPDP